MNPATIALVMQFVELVISEEPAMATELTALFSKGTPTAADFAALNARIMAESYKQFVPASDLPAAQTGQ